MEKNVKYHDLYNSYYDGIQGVQVIEGQNAGPNVGISVCTHGSETVGLEIIDNIKNEVEIVNGKLYLILTNILAYEKNQYMKAMGKLDPKDLLVNARYIDENMNRCCSGENLESPNNYERSRAKELVSILKGLDFLLDIHSTYTDTGSMMIHSVNSYEKFKDVFDADEVYVGLPEMVVGKPFGDIVDRNGGIGMAIESGSQLNNTSYKTGSDNVLRLISYLNMGNKNHDLIKEKRNKEIEIIGSIIVRNTSFKAVRTFEHGDSVSKGELIAYDGEKDVYAKEDCCIVLPANHRPGEEFCFLAKIPQ